MMKNWELLLLLIEGRDSLAPQIGLVVNILNESHYKQHIQDSSSIHMRRYMLLGPVYLSCNNIEQTLDWSSHRLLDTGTSPLRYKPRSEHEKA